MGPIHYALGCIWSRPIEATNHLDFWKDVMDWIIMYPDLLALACTCKHLYRHMRARRCKLSGEGGSLLSGCRLTIDKATPNWPKTVLSQSLKIRVLGNVVMLGYCGTRAPWHGPAIALEAGDITNATAPYIVALFEYGKPCYPLFSFHTVLRGHGNDTLAKVITDINQVPTQGTSGVLWRLAEQRSPFRYSRGNPYQVDMNIYLNAQTRIHRIKLFPSYESNGRIYVTAKVEAHDTIALIILSDTRRDNTELSFTCNAESVADLVDALRFNYFKTLCNPYYPSSTAFGEFLQRALTSQLTKKQMGHLLDPTLHTEMRQVLVPTIGTDEGANRDTSTRQS